MLRNILDLFKRTTAAPMTISTEIAPPEEMVSTVRRELARAAHRRNGLVVGLLHLEGPQESLDAREVGSLMGQVLREDDTVLRILSNRFLILARVSEAKSGHQLADHLMGRFDQLAEGKNWALTPCAGFLYLPRPKAVDDVQQILQAADNLVAEVAAVTGSSFLLRGWI